MKKICCGIVFFYCLSYGYAQRVLTKQSGIESAAASSWLTDPQGLYPPSNLVDYTYPIKDSIHFEQYPLKSPAAGTKIQFMIEDVYQGTDYNDTCIAEIALLTDMMDDESFYHRAGIGGKNRLYTNA